MDSSLVRDTVQGSSPYEQWPKGPWVQSPDMILKHAATYSVENRELLYGLLDAFFAE
jgi:hypothetical protein